MLQEILELERLARVVWGDAVGQIIARKIVAIYPVRSGLDVFKDSPLLYIDHGKHSVPAALAALRVLADEKPACVHIWIETSRDTGDEGTLATVNERCKLCGAEQSLTSEPETMEAALASAR